MITGLQCAVCQTWVDIAAACPWRCPRAGAADPYHVLHLVDDGRPVGDIDDPNPFVRYGRRLAWWAFAAANGMSDDACAALTRDVAGDFTVTPFTQSTPLSDALGHELWVKDETHNVAGSHKARHLMGLLLYLAVVEGGPGRAAAPAAQAPLAIASCGNAALGAAVAAAACAKAPGALP